MNSAKLKQPDNNVDSSRLFDSAYLKVQTDRGFLRTFIRGFYLRRIASHCQGRTADIGCGSGALLKLLQPGSVGYEINQAAVSHCHRLGLNVHLISPVKPLEQIALTLPEKCDSLAMNHVLEHLEDPQQYLSDLLELVYRTSIRRLIFILPGKKGYASDVTHRNFIDKTWFEKNVFSTNPGLRIMASYYYPVNFAWFGNFFRHNEWHMVLEVKNKDQVSGNS